jgi:hypothetical protein
MTTLPEVWWPACIYCATNEHDKCIPREKHESGLFVNVCECGDGDHADRTD